MRRFHFSKFQSLGPLPRAPRMLQARVMQELRMIENDPPQGVALWPRDGRINDLEATIDGPAGTPYEGGVFRLSVLLPDRYPHEPPKVKVHLALRACPIVTAPQFVTPIYHPNIDSEGRICLDTLSMPPKGAWTAVLNICALLKTIQALMSTPNPDDPLMADIVRHRNVPHDACLTFPHRTRSTSQTDSSSSRRRANRREVSPWATRHPRPPRRYAPAHAPSRTPERALRVGEGGGAARGAFGVL